MIKLSRWLLVILCLGTWIRSAGSQPERVERGSLVIEGIPEIPQSITSRLNRYQNIRSATLAVSPLNHSDNRVTPSAVQSFG